MMIKNFYHKYSRPSDKITSIAEFHEIPIGMGLAIATEKIGVILTLIIPKALDTMKRFFFNIHKSYVTYNIVYLFNIILLPHGAVIYKE